MKEQFSYKSYVTGFVASLSLTLAAYILVATHAFSPKVAIGLISALALTQFIVQMLFFLHLGRETKPRWKLLVFIFMVGVVAILVFGSLWIMANLDYHHQLTPQQIIKDEGIGQ